MGLDNRLPIGIRSSRPGLLLASYDRLAGASRYQQSIGVKPSFLWGIALLAYGLSMPLPGRRGVLVAPQSPHSPESSDD